MKKLPLRLDGTSEVVYGLRVEGAVYGPYATPAAAKKAASKARITAEVVRITMIPVVESAGVYNGGSQ